MIKPLWVGGVEPLLLWGIVIDSCMTNHRVALGEGSSP